MIEKLTPTDFGGFFDENGCHWATKKQYLEQGILHQCGCGDTDSIVKYISEMLITHVGETTWDSNNYDDMPVMFFLSWADNQGYIEHGCSIRCSWLTPKGFD